MDHTLSEPADGDECEIEVLQLFELEDFSPNEAVERFPNMRIGTEKK
jgi:predicted component of type VI protein secretion system